MSVQRRTALVRWAELAVTGIAETGHDERVFIEMAVDRRGDDVQVHSRGLQELDSFRGCEHACDEDRVAGTAIDQNLAAMGQ